MFLVFRKTQHNSKDIWTFHKELWTEDQVKFNQSHNKVEDIFVLETSTFNDVSKLKKDTEIMLNAGDTY